jgi:folate-binding protein YgfZ
MTDGYQALRENAALIDLSSRGRIKVTGEDRARLLHAMTTNHVNDLVPGMGCYAFFLNAQGRILADANILCFDDHLLLDVEPESRAFLMEHLEKYIIADDVTPEDISRSTFSLGIEGPGAELVLHHAGLPAPGVALAHQTEGPLTIIRASFTGAPGFRIIGPAGDTRLIAGAIPTSPENAKVVRLEHFFPRYGDDITTANLPQETGITDALHFNKGCYLGQEIVERVRSRGHVNRSLTGLRIEGNQPFERAEKISSEGAEVGEITSSAYSPALDQTLAMAYIRVLAAKPGTQVSVAGRSGQCAAIKSSRT